MTTPKSYALAILFTAIVAGAGGWFLGSQGDRTLVQDLESEVATKGRRISVLEDEVQLYRDNRPRSIPMADSTETADRAPAGSAVELVPGGEALAPPGDVTADAAPLSPEQRRARIAEIRAGVDGWFAEGKGREALDALKQLAALAPEGREAAMDLAVRINQDVNGAGELKLSQMVFYTNLGDPPMVDLFRWSLDGNPASAEFRQMSVYSLPWTQDQDKTLVQFLSLLETDRDRGVQRALVYNLSQMRRPEADSALAKIMDDPSKDKVLRTQALTAMAMSDNAEVVRSIENLALGDPDPDVRNAAKAAMKMRDPPATGYMVTGTLPESQAEAAGMVAGDIIVSYGGRETRTLTDLRSAASESGGAESVRVVVVRDGREVPLDIRPGQMGIFGREVKRK